MKLPVLITIVNIQGWARDVNAGDRPANLNSVIDSKKTEQFPVFRVFNFKNCPFGWETACTTVRNSKC